MSDLTIRPATLTDLHTLNFISRVSKQYWGYPDEWIEQWREALDVTEVDIIRERVAVGHSHDSIVGFIKILEGPTSYEIDQLFIHPQHIGKGYGQQLLKAVIDACDPGKEMIVVSDPNSVGFYQKMGFETYDQVESYPPGRYLPVMKRVTL